VFGGAACRTDIIETAIGFAVGHLNDLGHVRVSVLALHVRLQVAEVRAEVGQLARGHWLLAEEQDTVGEEGVLNRFDRRGIKRLAHVRSADFCTTRVARGSNLDRHVCLQD